MKLIIVTQRDPIFVDRFLRDIDYSLFNDVTIYDSPNFGSGKLTGLKKFITLFGLRYTIKEILALLLNGKITVPVVKKNWDDVCTLLNHADLSNTVLLSVSAPHKIPEKVLERIRLGLNVHCGKLPYYAGMMPVFWQYAEKRKGICITLHHLEKEIDQGEIIQELFVPVSGDLLQDMKKVKSVSAILFNSFIVKELETYSGSSQKFRKYTSLDIIKKVLRK